MKKLYRRLAATFALSTCFLALLFGVSLYGRGMTESGHALRQLLDSAAANLKAAGDDQDERLELLKEELLARARVVEYIVARDYGALEANDGLSVLRELMDVACIRVLDENGSVLMQSGGGGEVSAPEASGGAYAEPGADGRPSAVYAVALSTHGPFAAVRVDADVARLGLLTRGELVRATVRAATTEYETSLVAVDAGTGEVLAMSENNSQQFDVAGAASPDELARLIGGAEGKAAVWTVNGALQHAAVLRAGNVYLVAFSPVSRILKSMTRTVFETLTGIGVIGLLTFLLVHYHIRRMERELLCAQTEAQFDKLTGLYNRSGFERRAEEFLAQAQPRGVLVLFDLDNFKRVNDAEGHPEGDRVLRAFADCLTVSFRKSDCIGRLGGDEFIVLIPNAIPACILREKLDAVLANAREALRPYREKYDASASAGAAPADGSVHSYAEWYRRADEALYIAKSLGKDRHYVNGSPREKGDRTEHTAHDGSGGA